MERTSDAWKFSGHEDGCLRDSVSGYSAAPVVSRRMGLKGPALLIASAGDRVLEMATLFRQGGPSTARHLWRAVKSPQPSEGCSVARCQLVESIEAPALSTMGTLCDWLVLRILSRIHQTSHSLDLDGPVCSQDWMAGLFTAHSSAVFEMQNGKTNSPKLNGRP